MLTTTDVSTSGRPLLRPGELREPLLRALGRATNSTAGVFVPHTEVLDATIQEAGYDPDNLPHGWNRTRRSGRGQGAGLDRNISLAFRYAYRDQSPPLTLKGPKPGLWGLTEAGVAHVRGQVPQALPKPRIFHEPLVKVLGHLSGHTQMAVGHEQVIRAVMVEIGYDPDNLPPGWRERGTNRQIKAYDRVRWAVKSLKEAKTALIFQPNRGFWALTDAGIQKARKLNGEIPPLPAPRTPEAARKPPPRPDRPNETALWLQRHLRPDSGQTESRLYRMMRSALAKRLPVSACTEQLDDHIQTYMLRAIRRNALRKLIEAAAASESEVPYSKVVAYAVNSGRTDARDMGTEPVCRELYGARTERERREARQTQFDQPSRTWDTDGNVIPPEETTISEEDLDFDRVWGQVEQVVSDRKPIAGSRYAHILEMRMKGYTTREIAAAEGVSRNRAASMLAEARRCVRDGYAEGDLTGFLD